MQNKLEMLRIFCMAAESRNFKEAAMLLGISPQAVTRAVKELEEQRGEILFYRSTRQIKITADGERLAKQARQAVDSLDLLLAKGVKDKTDEMGGTVRLTVSSVLGRKLVVPALAEFARQYPDIVVDCVLTDSHSDVIDERIDIGNPSMTDPKATGSSAKLCCPGDSTKKTPAKPIAIPSHFRGCRD